MGLTFELESVVRVVAIVNACRISGEISGEHLASIWRRRIRLPACVNKINAYDLLALHVATRILLARQVTTHILLHRPNVPQKDCRQYVNICRQKKINADDFISGANLSGASRRGLDFLSQILK